VVGWWFGKFVSSFNGGFMSGLVFIYVLLIWLVGRFFVYWYDESVGWLVLYIGLMRVLVG
jgi:hypothetical protein